MLNFLYVINVFSYFINLNFQFDFNSFLIYVIIIIIRLISILI
jgi:hypothetical protein